MAQLTHEEAIKRAEYVGQVAEAELFEADRNGGVLDQAQRRHSRDAAAPFVAS